MTAVSVINGPNLNMLGQREVAIYGSTTLSQIKTHCLALCEQFKLRLNWLQSQAEHELITWIHEACALYPSGEHAGIVINPGAYAHTSIAIADALRSYPGPSYEVHISNVHKREEYRRHSFVAAAVTGSIGGCGAFGYHLALTAVHHHRSSA